MAKNAAKPIELQGVDATTISAITWTPFNTAGLEGACFFLRFNNDTTSDIQISYDGVTAHDFIKSYTDFSVNFQTNASPNNGVCKVPKKTVIYVSGAVGTGNIYLSGFYNE